MKSWSLIKGPLERWISVLVVVADTAVARIQSFNLCLISDVLAFVLFSGNRCLFLCCSSVSLLKMCFFFGKVNNWNVEQIVGGLMLHVDNLSWFRRMLMKAIIGYWCVKLGVLYHHFYMRCMPCTFAGKVNYPVYLLLLINY